LPLYLYRSLSPFSLLPHSSSVSDPHSSLPLLLSFILFYLFPFPLLLFCLRHCCLCHHGAVHVDCVRMMGTDVTRMYITVRACLRPAVLVARVFIVKILLYRRIVWH
jgi:hypothetical protein